VKRQLGLFLAGALGIWVVLFALAWLLWPDHRETSLAASLTALTLCLVPTVVTFLWSAWVVKGDPNQQLVAVLGGTGIRMFFVLGVGFLLGSTVPALEEKPIPFWLWVLVFYLLTLALEMTLILRARLAWEKANGAGTTTPLPR